MRVSLVANFPFHFLPGFERERPVGHFATWLPQLSEEFEAVPEIDFHWITISKLHGSTAPIRWRGQTFHLLRNPQRLRMLRAYWRDCRLIRSQLDRLQPDLVHAWGSEDCYGLAAAGSGRRWLLSMQGLLQEYVRRAPMHPFVRLQALYEKSILRRARDITVESHWGEDVLRRLAPRANLYHVEYGVQAAFFNQSWEPDPICRHAVFVGTPEERKGIDDAVTAFANPALASSELRIIGDSDTPLVKKLKAKASPNVRWFGRLGTLETAQALGRAWCLLLPTRADTSPNVVKEARVIGLPVVTTAAGGQSDYIFDGVNGYIVAPGDITSLSDRLSRIFSNLETTRAMGIAHHQQQREHFRPVHTATRFLDLYRRLALPRRNTSPEV